MRIMQIRLELVFRQIPGKSAQWRGRAERLGRRLPVALVDPVGGRVAGIAGSPVGLDLPPARSLAVRLTAGALAVTDSRVRTEPPPTDPTRPLPGIRHARPSSNRFQEVNFWRARAGQSWRAPKPDEERRYLEACTAIGDGILEAYRRALTGIRAVQRGERPIKPEDPYLLRDVATLPIDCGLGPEECFRLRWAHVRDSAVHVLYGKTNNARRVISLPQRAAGLLEMRRANRGGEWVFPAPTKSGHIEKSTLKRQHRRACELAKVEFFTLYTFRHTCLTRWAAYMDPYTLAYLAGHSDFATTRRYVHPQSETVRAAMERARVGSQGSHVFSHGDEKPAESPKRSTAVIN